MAAASRCCWVASQAWNTAWANSAGAEGTVWDLQGIWKGIKHFRKRVAGMLPQECVDFGAIGLSAHARQVRLLLLGHTVQQQPRQYSFRGSDGALPDE